MRRMAYHPYYQQPPAAVPTQGVAPAIATAPAAVPTAAASPPQFKQQYWLSNFTLQKFMKKCFRLVCDLKHERDSGGWSSVLADKKQGLRCFLQTFSNCQKLK